MIRRLQFASRIPRHYAHCRLSSRRDGDGSDSNGFKWWRNIVLNLKKIWVCQIFISSEIYSKIITHLNVYKTVYFYGCICETSQNRYCNSRSYTLESGVVSSIDWGCLWKYYISLLTLNMNWSCRGNPFQGHSWPFGCIIIFWVHF